MNLYRKMKIFYKPSGTEADTMGVDKEELRMKELRTAVHDDELRIEAYRFGGIVQPKRTMFDENQSK